MLEISQLQTVLAVTHCGSFSKAAEKLHVTQSAISQSVKNLEKKLGVEVFRRTGKKILLTGEGEKVYKLAKEFMKKMEDTLSDIKHDKDVVAGKVRVGTLTGVGKSWLAPEIMKLSQIHDNLTLIVKIGFVEDIIKEFERGELDVVILPENYLPEEGEKVFLSEEKATLVFPKNGKFPIDKNISCEELEKYPTILFEEDDYLYTKWFQEHFNKRPTKINTKYVVNVHGNILQAVAEGLGTAVVPVHVLDRSSYKDRVISLGEDFEIPNFNFYLVYHKEALALKRVEAVVEFLKSFDNPLC